MITDRNTKGSVMQAEQKFHNIHIIYNKCAIHIKNDEALKSYMGYNHEKALTLSRYIRKSYKRYFNEPLRITTVSLAVEILAHFFLQELFLKIEKKIKFVHGMGKMRLFCTWMLNHMDVIDCGDLQSDNNRFLWDFLAGPAKILWRARGSGSLAPKD